MRAIQPLRRRLDITSSDDGVVLMFVVIFVLVFGLISAALLNGITVGTRNTATVRSFDLRTYQADGAIDYGIQALRNDNTICPDTSTPADIAAPAALGVTLHCQTLSGSASGGLGYAVIATGGGIATKNGGSKRIDGPVWSAGFSIQGASLTMDGDVTDKTTAASCATDKSAITFIAPHGLTCTQSGTAPAVQAGTVNVAGMGLTTHPVVGGHFVADLKKGNCSVFKPGSYDGSTGATFTLGTTNYFASGVYLLKNVTLTLGQTLIAGEPGPGETYKNTQSLTACSNDTVAGEANHANGYGAMFLLDGSANISVIGGMLETFARSGGDANVEGAQGISLRTATTWSGTKALSIAPGVGQELQMHGLIYTPTAEIDLGVTSAPAANVYGGVVCDTIDVGHAANVSNGTEISVNTGIGYRHILLTATSSGGGGGERDVVATAVIDVVNDVDRTYVIESRRNGGFSSTT